MERYHNKNVDSNPASEDASQETTQKLPSKNMKKKDPGPLPIDPQKTAKYKRGRFVNPKHATNLPLQQKRLRQVKKKYREAVIKSAQSELLLTEESGFIEPDQHEKTYQITQKEIQDNVDITSASKHFDLTLDFGPYRLDYFRNGRSMLFGGRRGHVACFDWLTKDLKCEFNVQESVHDVQFLHIPTMFAIAQKDWVHIYDDKGIELHCLKKLFRVHRMNFLPYHFLLVTGSENGFLSWLDISTGELVTSFRMNHANNRFTCLEQNPTNAIIHTGHPNGTVALWSPNQQQPLAQMLAHKSSVRGMTISDDGHYMVTTCVDRTFNVTDLRTFKILFEYRVRSVPTHVSFSQRNMLALSIGDIVEVYRDVTKEPATEPYLRHRLSSHIEDVSFVNYEDVLGVSHAKGISSLLIPGSGEPNFDAFESNPFMTTSQKREMEVKNLLDKIPANLISLDPMELGKVDIEGLNKEMEMKKHLLHVKTPKIQLDRNKGRKKTRKAITQQQLRDEATQHRVRKIREVEESKAHEAGDTTERQEPPVVKDIYSRFQSKF